MFGRHSLRVRVIVALSVLIGVSVLWNSVSLMSRSSCEDGRIHENNGQLIHTLRAELIAEQAKTAILSSRVQAFLSQSSVASSQFATQHENSFDRRNRLDQSHVNEQAKPYTAKAGLDLATSDDRIPRAAITDFANTTGARVLHLRGSEQPHEWTAKEREQEQRRFVSFAQLRERTDIPSLIIGINTVPRPSKDGQALTYLRKTLHRLAELFPPPPPGKQPWVHVYVVACVTEAYPQFNDLKHELRDHPSFHFFHETMALPDPIGQEADDKGNANNPGHRVRKQTRDIVSVMRLASDQSAYYLFMEDDFWLCDHGQEVLQYLPRKAASIDQDWISIRLGFGMNGFMIKNGVDLDRFATYLHKHQARRPPDHLSVEWSAGETPEALSQKGQRTHLTYRFNVFHHMGTVSTLGHVDEAATDRCFDQLDPGVLFEVEAYLEDRCAHDDITPCHAPDHGLIPPLFLSHPNDTD